MTGEPDRVYAFIKRFIRIIGASQTMSGVVWVSSRLYCHWNRLEARSRATGGIPVIFIPDETNATKKSLKVPR